jgi:hypothetical protein
MIVDTIRLTKQKLVDSVGRTIPANCLNSVKLFFCQFSQAEAEHVNVYQPGEK